MTRSTALGEERLNMQSWVAISISGAYEWVPVEVRASRISNYPCDGGSRHREGDKWNLHVVLTGGKTDREAFSAGALSTKPSTSGEMMQNNHFHLREGNY